MDHRRPRTGSSALFAFIGDTCQCMGAHPRPHRRGPRVRPGLPAARTNEGHRQWRRRLSRPHPRTSSRRRAGRTPPSGLVDLDGRRFYRITSYDDLPPFFMTLVGASDLWLFISSTGGRHRRARGGRPRAVPVRHRGQGRRGCRPDRRADAPARRHGRRHRVLAAVRAAPAGRPGRRAQPLQGPARHDARVRGEPPGPGSARARDVAHRRPVRRRARGRGRLDDRPPRPGRGPRRVRRPAARGRHGADAGRAQQPARRVQAGRGRRRDRARPRLPELDAHRQGRPERVALDDRRLAGRPRASSTTCSPSARSPRSRPAAPSSRSTRSAARRAPTWSTRASRLAPGERRRWSVVADVDQSAADVVRLQTLLADPAAAAAALAADVEAHARTPRPARRDRRRRAGHGRRARHRAPPRERAVQRHARRRPRRRVHRPHGRPACLRRSAQPADRGRAAARGSTRSPRPSSSTTSSSGPTRPATRTCCGSCASTCR